MGRYRFGEGEYRYFTEPFPEAVVALIQALYPNLLPIARDWWAKLSRESPWPDSLDDWRRMCHAAGQTKPTPIPLKYGVGDWKALHRDLYGELVFPLQVVINLNDVANALKPRYLPGEHMRIKVIREGESFGQGVGYLDDGTMVVCEQAAAHIGKEIDVIVSSVLQNSAGRMIFGRLPTSPVPAGQIPAR